MALTTVDAGLLNSQSQQTWRNRIINGAMVIDQRNAGASVTVSTDFTYNVDRFSGSKAGVNNFTMQQSTTVPTGFKNSVLVTMGTGASVSTTNYALIAQAIEGQNVADFNLGTSSSSTFTLSFWVRSSLTGTFGVAFRGGAANATYCSTYTINSANTFEYKTITVPAGAINGGTWYNDNRVGIYVIWDLGVGSTYRAPANQLTTGANYFGVNGCVNLCETTGATFYITGVQLEKGSTATSFDYRPYGTELGLCERYYQKTYEYSNTPGSYGGNGSGYLSGRYVTSYAQVEWSFKVDMRTTPTVTTYAPFDGTSGKCWIDSTGSANTALGGGTGNKSIMINCGTSNSNPFYFHATASAEL